MQRFGDVIRVPADRYAEYVDKHDHIWPNIVELMRQAHIENFTIFTGMGICSNTLSTRATISCLT